jgi:hypothetical protein
MFDIKPLSIDAIPAALEKARCYRFLNEPLEAESICLDILATAPGNQQALITLILALTDQFGGELSRPFAHASELILRLEDEFDRNYYFGIICERRAKAHLDRGAPGSGPIAYDWLRKAMQAYEKAIANRLAGNDDAILRWNACARMIMRHPEVVPPEEQIPEQMLE